MLTAREIMTEEVVTVGPKSSIQEAIDLILSRQVSGLPVIDNEGHIAGIVTEFALMGIAYDNQICQDTVDKHMTTEVLSVGPNDALGKVVDLCIVHRVRRVPVVENGRLIGLIARRDVLKAICEAQAPICTA